VTEDPARICLLKLAELLQCIAGSSFNKRCSTGGCNTFVGMVVEMVLMVIQKTTGVKLVGPTQHLLFSSYKIRYRKGEKFIVQYSSSASYLFPSSCA